MSIPVPIVGSALLERGLLSIVGLVRFAKGLGEEWVFGAGTAAERAAPARRKERRKDGWVRCILGVCAELCADEARTRTRFDVCDFLIGI